MAAKIINAQSSTSRRHVLTRSFSTRLIVHRSGATEFRRAEICEDNFRGRHHRMGGLVIQHSYPVQQTNSSAPPACPRRRTRRGKVMLVLVIVIVIVGRNRTEGTKDTKRIRRALSGIISCVTN